MSIKVCVFDAYGTLFDVTLGGPGSVQMKPGRSSFQPSWPSTG